ncbi:Hachiman antiphage defense system protein HamA [Mesomycoplasma lagogenitalium]|uniref:SAVED domain-containing protein n=1 Tax=Mesomycoplasma lagogenitalium TaxID=171286 RepID=A0ABY8LT71_9BACT|nr:Hachiman antiphage defense system protein HamA [Mesomycoplasma lagogenitalium]WGI36452.1 SAVED domain-containing protein [Mesomycoplasma lagogenitalium]
MNGIIEIKKEGYIILEIRNLTDELKKTIKNLLVEICHGEYANDSKFKLFSFDETIKELVEHRLKKDKIKQIGAVGEILLNVVIREFTDMKIASPFFNIEERSAKKGFDIIAIDSDKKLWIIESKAGEIGNFSSPTEKSCLLIKKAKMDLYTRLNDKNSQIWSNAVKSVNSSLNDSDEKKVIMDILITNGNSDSSKDKNVVLGATVFCLLDKTIEPSKINDLYKSILEMKKFSEIKLIAIQKKTYDAVIEFLSSLVKKNEYY